jgi:hypothetical protein
VAEDVRGIFIATIWISACCKNSSQLEKRMQSKVKNELRSSRTSWQTFPPLHRTWPERFCPRVLGGIHRRSRVVGVDPNPRVSLWTALLSLQAQSYGHGGDGAPPSCAREGAKSGRWKSSSAQFADWAVVERNCVRKNGGGEQRETKVPSAR